MKKCDWNTLTSVELSHLNKLGFVGQDITTVVYHTALERTERERNYWRIRAMKAEQRREDDERTIERLENTCQGFRTIIRLLCI